MLGVILRDITSNLIAEKKSNLNEERYKAISELVSDYAFSIIYRANGSKEIDWITSEFSKITGYSLEEINRIGGFESIIVPEDLYIYERHLKELAKNIISSAEFRIKTKTGLHRWLTQTSKQFFANDKLNRVYSAGRDITINKKYENELLESYASLEERIEERTSSLDQAVKALQNEILQRVRAEENLKVKEEYFRTITERGSDAILIIDETYKIKYTSPAALKESGYGLETFIDNIFLWFILEEDKSTFIAKFQNVINNHNVEEPIEIRLIHEKNQYTFYELKFKNMLESPLIQGVIINIRNIGERKKLQNELAQAQKMDAIGRLAGGVAHDFNNILTVIIGYAEVITSKYNVDEKLAGWIEHIKNSANKATGLVRQLLLFSRKQAIQTRILDLNELVENIKKLLEKTY